MSPQQRLPIDDVLHELCTLLRAHTSVVLEAPPGAGKTTRVPLALLDEPWLGSQRIIMLEPRRLAARSAAHYMARQLGEQVGGRIGFRVRGETQVSARTRIELVTEGILARLIAADAALEGIGLVIFDEFHERSLHADLGLALTLQTQQVLRSELRILVMSATIDGDAVSTMLGNAHSDSSADATASFTATANISANPVNTVSISAPLVRSAGRMFPVSTEYRAPRNDERLESAVARTVREALLEHTGDILVFLPGAGEQRRVAERLVNSDAVHDQHARVYQLHGTMPLAEQDAAIAAAPDGTRKVVLATSIAETSLTIEGVRVVIDSGLSRLPRYSARAGFTRLETVRVSRASADQRRGRAGRVAPGVCFRLWDAHMDATLAPRTRPEILEADLAPLALALADAGVRDPAELTWMDTPPAGAFRQAVELLTALGAVDNSGRITAHGRQLGTLPVHPRLGHLLLTARAQNRGDAGAALAALIDERDVLRGEFGPPPADLRLRLELLEGASAQSMSVSLPSVRVDGDGVRRLRQVARELRGRGVQSAKAAPSDAGSQSLADDAGLLLSMAYPDRVAQHRPGSEPRFLLRNGVGASLLRHDALASEPFLAVADLDGAPPEYRIARAIPLTRAEVMTTFREALVRESVVDWDDDARAVRARKRLMLGAIVLEDHAVHAPDASEVTRVLTDEIRRAGIDALPWSDGGTALRARLDFLHHHDTSWPDVSAGALNTTVELWLAPLLSGIRRWDELAKVDFAEALRSLLSWEQRAAIDQLAPTHLDVPSGSRIALKYDDPANPVLAVKLQEVFGWTSTPTLLNGRVPVTLHLLSPAQRPVQVTRDLAGFWRTSYFDVRKDLRGRYPRHPWPEDPLSAAPTRRAKPRGT